MTSLSTLDVAGRRLVDVPMTLTFPLDNLSRGRYS
jgi:hypothetical protein